MTPPAPLGDHPRDARRARQLTQLAGREGAVVVEGASSTGPLYCIVILEKWCDLGYSCTRQTHGTLVRGRGVAMQVVHWHPREERRREGGVASYDRYDTMELC